MVVDGVSVGAFADTGTSAWKLRSLTFALLGGPHAFGFVGGSGADTLLDNVSLDVAGAAVPDPGSSLAFLGSAFVSLGLLRGRRPMA